MGARLRDGEAWQCLRCGAYVRGLPNLSGPAAAAPMVPRGKEVRSRLILRLFAIERFLRAVVIGTAAVGLWQFRDSQTSIEQRFDRDLPALRGLFRQLGYNIDNSKLVGLLHHALTLSSKTLTLLAIGLALYAVIELVEGTGLWLARRWGEYFAMVATSLGLPLEIYDLTRKVTVLALIVLAVNLALVLYLVITKRLFGVRGGKQAYDARLRSESVLEAAANAAALERQPAAAQPPATQPRATDPPTALARAAQPPGAQASGTAPPAPQAPATQAPATGPPGTEPARSASAQLADPVAAAARRAHLAASAEPAGKVCDGPGPK